MAIIPLFFYILTKKGAIHMKKKLITAVVTFALALSSLTDVAVQQQVETQVHRQQEIVQ